jgi:XTP/dITP diphosphohydrolase
MTVISDIRPLIVLASHNPGKIRDFEEYFDVPFVPQHELGVPECPEPFCTFVENALAKARNASLHTGLPAIGDDSGICVKYLNDAPGVYSARYPGGYHALLEQMCDIEDRTAYQITTLVFVRRHDDPRPIIVEGLVFGSLAREVKGTNGFGYDCVFELPAPFNCNMAELNDHNLGRISHRMQAIIELNRALLNY